MEELTTEKKLNLLKTIKNSERAGQLSDGELIDEVCVNCVFDITGYEQALIDELITRFQTAIGLEETPLGIPVNKEI